VRRSVSLVVVAACSSLVLAGCSGSSGSSSTGGSSSASSASSGSSSASGALPSVSGSYGQKPTLTFGQKKAPAGLQQKTLSEGGGPTVAKGDLLVADYLGQVWNGKVFDNSYDRNQPAAFQIGTGKVIAGWDETLVGKKVGSRVLLVIPPDKGYGAQGNAQAGIKGTDTLVFVVDIVGKYGKDAHGDAKATPQHASTGGVKVGGTLGGQPTVAVTKGAKPPAKPTTVLLDKGHGPVVKPGLVVLQYTAVTWAGKPAGSTWQDGVPVGVPVASSAGSASPFDQLIGLPVGSRALIRLPAQKAAQAKTQSVAAVVDIVAQPLPAKDSAGK
jgi:peptidylprolyl isomerase